MPGEVEGKQQIEGPNKLTEKKKKSLFLIFLGEFKDPMVIVLFVPRLISIRLRHL
jgi:Ca2+-transporting ATPase